MRTQTMGNGCTSHQALPSCSSRHVFGPRRCMRTAVLPVKATLTTSEPTNKDKPDWTGDHVLSRVVNWAINTPPLYGAMKVMAKQAMKNSAEGRGVRWDQHVREMEKRQELEAIKDELEDKSVLYPSYYLKPFHAYDTGNLGWLQAFEVQPATYTMSIRTFKDKKEWTPEQCFVEQRSRASNSLKSYMERHGVPQPSRVVDMGCSTGLSTQWLAQEFSGASEVVGLDLSPYFLAVAEWERRRRADLVPQQLEASGVWKARSAPITYKHGLAEQSPFADSSQDLVAFNFVIHECPGEVIETFIAEARRILKPGGVLNFVDNNPRSKTIQNLPPFLFTLMKSTEPWSDSYYAYDVEAAMRAAGFREVITVEADHRHRSVMGILE